MYTLIAQPSCDQVCSDLEWLLYRFEMPGVDPVLDGTIFFTFDAI